MPLTGAAAGSEEVREMAELHRAFFSLLHFAAANGLTGTLLRLEGPLLDSVLQELLASASAHAEASVRRGCFQARILCSSNIELPPVQCTNIVRVPMRLN